MSEIKNFDPREGMHDPFTPEEEREYSRLLFKAIGQSRSSATTNEINFTMADENGEDVKFRLTAMIGLRIVKDGE